MCIKFLFDEGIGHDFVKAFKLLGKNVEHVLDNFPQATKDEVWLEYAGKNNLVLVTKDKSIRKNPSEKALIIKYGIVAFYLGGSEKSGQDIAKQLINAWSTMEAIAKKQHKKGLASAFIIRPSGNVLKEIPLT
ncbi:MAG: DUF5615 family PIN-like protein [Gammaproteobacteria bacterium]|nr:DUF5615 family PIN-like protein [Gammaproteobacteria bacterium]